MGKLPKMTLNPLNVASLGLGQWLVQHVQKSFFTSTNNRFCLFAIMKLVSSVAGNLRPMLLANLYCTYST